MVSYGALHALLPKCCQGGFLPHVHLLLVIYRTISNRT